jgi:hypothetical protein
VLKQLDIHKQKKGKRNELYQTLNLMQNLIQKQITDLNVKYKTIKVLDNNIRENLQDLEQ